MTMTSLHQVFIFITKAETGGLTFFNIKPLGYQPTRLTTFNILRRLVEGIDNFIQRFLRDIAVT